ncbi:MAG: flavodoxin-dependent (E)-4-hydroxy-3-methylbut-2-enyl-diphosphate synthase [Bacillota bacterium]
MSSTIIRRVCSQVSVGGVLIGGNAPVSIQSMTNVDTRNIILTVEQIKSLSSLGCDIVRLAVQDMEAANAIETIKMIVKDVPLVADIHFDYRLALECIKNGIDKVRINPGNIGDKDRVREVVTAAKERGIPIRVGVNSGSVEKEILAKYGEPSAEAMVESALGHVRILEDLNFTDTVISLKASNVMTTIDAYRILASKCEYPLHVGVTEAGTLKSGTLKSAIGIGTLLAEGIGDTIRVSLTSEPENEVTTAQEILKALGIRNKGVEFISCPTCGRCQIDLIGIAEQVELALKNCDKDIKVAVMGCGVNGPGEAREADIGIAGGDNCAILFRHGEIVRRIPQSEVVAELLKEIEKL